MKPDAFRLTVVPHGTHRRIRCSFLAAAAAGLALVAAGCGGSKGSHVAQLGTTSSRSSSYANTSSPSTRVSGAVAYAHCMRSDGVPNWPDPNSSGVFDKSQLTLQELGVSSSRLQATQSACRHLLPNGGQPPSPAQLQQVEAQALRFSECVRAHGVPGFPDPGSDGRIPDPASVGIDQGSPTFEAANQACGKYRPPYVPANAAYNAYARSQG